MAFDKLKSGYEALKNIKNKSSAAYKTARTAFQKDASVAFSNIVKPGALGQMYSLGHRGRSAKRDGVTITIGVNGIFLNAKNSIRYEALKAALEYHEIDYRDKGGCRVYVELDEPSASEDEDE